MPASAESAELILAEQVGALADDPLGYVFFAFPWDADPDLRVVPLVEPWRSRYDSEYGPDGWACESLEHLGEAIRARGFDPLRPVSVPAIRGAWSSGHGIGKSALIAKIASFLLDTRPGSVITVTANTGNQLRTKTFPRIAFWKRKAITAHWWEISDGGLYVRHRTSQSWRLDAVTWSKETTEAFAGQHAATTTSAYLFDESSAVDDQIHEVAQGGLTDGEPFYLLTGNPTRNHGFFHRAFHGERHRYDILRQIDSRTCYLPNKQEIAEWVALYGEDSDFVRVRVRGEFPRAGSKQLIPNDVVALARSREATSLRDDATVLGVDVARFGSAESVIAIRRGRDARSIPWRYYRGLDGHQLAARVCETCDELRVAGIPPRAVCIDAGGSGGPVADFVAARGYPVVMVNFGSKADDSTRYLRRDVEMWDRTREWLEDGGAIPDDPTLSDQLTAREYGFTPSNQKHLESKDMLEKRGLESPDRADALALTLAVRIAPLSPAMAHELSRPTTEFDVHAR